MGNCPPCEKAKLALQKASNIVEGYYNLVIKDNVVEELACKRISICLACEFKVPLVRVNEKWYFSCSKCNCPIDAKTRSTGERCPLGKWE